LLAAAVLLFLISFIFNSYYTRVSSLAVEKRSITNYVQEQENDFNDLVKDTALLRELILNNESLEEFKSLAKKKYSIFLFAESISEQQQMLFWSSQTIAPSSVNDTLSYGEYFRKLANGDYVILKKFFWLKGMTNKLWAYAMIPVKYEYYIDYQYLKPAFAHSKNAIRRIDISTKPTGYPINSTSGKTLFYIKHVQNVLPYNDTFTVVLRLAALLLFFIFSHSLAESVAQKNRSEWRGVVALITILLVFRVTIYFFPLLFQFRQFELFDPSIYAGNFINKSLGDLLINSLLFSWVAVFAWSKLGNKVDRLQRLNEPTKWILGAASLSILIVSTFTLASTIRSLVTDSQISFDVTNFFSLSKYTVVGFIVLASLSLGYYYFTQLMLRLILLVFENRKAWIYFAIALTGLIYLSFNANDPSVQFYIPVLLWMIAYTWLVSRQELTINRFNFNVTGMLFWIFIFCVSISAIILTENRAKEWEKRKIMAENLASQFDESNETLLSIAVSSLDSNFLLRNFSRFNDEEQSRVLKDSILLATYQGFLNKYNMRFYVFDSANRGLYNEDNTTFEALNNIIDIQSKASKLIRDLYYYVSSSNKVTYVTRRIVRDEAGKSVGTVFILSSSRKYGTDELEASIVKEPHADDPTESPVYSYAIYSRDGKTWSLVEYSSKYPFAISLTADRVPRQETEKKSQEDYDELWYRDSSEKVVILARKKESLIAAITLFSYLFCSFLFLVTFMQTLSLLLNLSLRKTKVRNAFQMNIRSQVHSTIIFISLVSFLIIGAATISFFIKRYNRNNEDKLSRAMKVMVNEMKKKIPEVMLKDTLRFSGGADNELKRLVAEVADIQNVNVNVYDLNGNLLVSSQENIYDNGVLSNKMHPEAYYHLVKRLEIERVQKENISDLSYLSIYAPVRDDKNAVYAYLNIPYFLSQFDLNQEISNFLVAIINLNAFIFLIAGVIALFITNRITRSFSLIGEKMREVNLGQLNEEIEWNRNDEIGELVKEYNKMVTKLGESAAILAKSEREGAWREMARQVAHEIKNPLTPMKLSIQYLQKAILNNSPNVKEMTQSVANTLVEQIDHLSKIAFDFSQFANIGTTKVELFDLHDVIRSLKELYHMEKHVEIDWKTSTEKAMLLADKTQMNRLFTNLFQNAVEACNGSERCMINVFETKQDGTITVSVKDNGQGIPPDIQSNIFAPNFTTKSSGTGLGLAMCKGIVEQAHGEIWFETAAGQGTIFHVKLPLAN
jgi:signal transduction histidine kinase